MDATVADPIIGRLIDGRYTAHEKLAVGGMATVYIAHDNRLDRMVALKVMHPNLMHEQGSVVRFHREAKAVAQLNSPQVVSVFDYGTARTTAGEVNYLVMELVRGRSLRQFLATQIRLPPDAAMDIIERVAEALAAAHGRGIIHRDIKPENILLGDDGQVKVADFGLARPIGMPTAAVTQGVVMGTVGYLAPEQVTHGSSDYRSDVYAAGIVLFEMLTGELPHNGETPMSVAYQSVHGDVPAPSTIVPGIPPVVDDLVLRATSRRPDERPPDGIALLEDVRRALPYVDADAPQATSVYPGGYSPALTPGYAPTLVGRPDLEGYLDTPGYEQAAYEQAGYRDELGGQEAGPVYTNQRGSHRGSGPNARRSRPPGWLIGVGAAIVALILLFVALHELVGGTSGVSVPLVVGETQADATNDLKAVGFKVAVGKKVYDDTQPAGHVLSQSPKDGSAKSGSMVTLVLSLGPALVTVPDLSGLNTTTAQTRLHGLGLAFAGTQQVPSSTVASGLVIDTLPKANTKVAPGSPVSLNISSGQLTVPDLVGKSYTDAQSALQGLGLTVAVDPSSTTDGSDSTAVVASTSPAANTQVQAGSRVALVLVPGGDGGGMVTVPDVRGESALNAKQDLNAAGLDITWKGKNAFFDWGAKVKSVDPKPGTSVPEGTKVTVTLG